MFTLLILLLGCPLEEATDCARTFYLDQDGDVYGDEVVCLEEGEARPEGVSAFNGDCDDSDPAANPEAYEVCDGADNDCDGLTDVDAIDAPTWHADADGDGYGDALNGPAACERPEGYVADASDCDDSDADVLACE